MDEKNWTYIDAGTELEEDVKNSLGLERFGTTSVHLERPVRLQEPHKFCTQGLTKQLKQQSGIQIVFL